MHTKYTDASTVTVGPGLWCMSYSSGVWGKEKKKVKKLCSFHHQGVMLLRRQSIPEVLFLET